MPFIEAHIARGLSRQRKQQLIRDIVAVTHEAIGSDPKIINVVIHEHEEVNMSISGRIAEDDDRDSG
jgi:4-oxalocrotonate tautomerase family enzyme